MKKTTLTKITLLALSVLLLFASCGNPSGKTEPESTSAQPTELLSESETETTQPEAPKYTVADNLIALTFDDGPGTDSSKKILRVLSENDAHATFFMVGYNIDEYPDAVKEAFDLGNEIANHTKGHKYLSKSSPETIHEEVNYVNDRVEEITGKRPTLLRAPGGNIGNSAGETGMPLIQWNIDTNDWRHKDKQGSSRTEEQRNSEINAIVDHVMTNVSPGCIILMHEIYDFSADVCELLIPKLAQAGYKMVTVSEMFEAYGIELKAGEVYRCAESQSAAASNTVKVEPGNYVVSTSSSALNLRQDASGNAAVLTEIPKGAAITVTESVEGWAKTSYGGFTGWVSTKYITPEQTTPSYMPAETQPQTADTPAQ